MSVEFRQWDVVKVRMTVFDCVFYPVVKKSAVSARLGTVSPARRRHLHQTIAAALRLFQ